MGRRTRVAVVSLGAAVVMAVAGPVGMASAADAHDTDSAPMPGGAGSITCTTDYDYSTSRASVHPVKTYCTNRTNRYIRWYGGHYSYNNTDGGGGVDLENSVVMNPGGTYTYHFSVSAPWSLKYHAEVQQFFQWKTGYETHVTNLF